MIAYQTDKYLYVIDMEYSEFITEVAKNGINSVATHLNTACVVLNNRFINTVNMYLPEITCHICEVGDSGQFLMNFSKINDLSDLKFYEADGQQFSCQASYDAYLRSRGEEVKPSSVNQERKDTETEKELKREPSHFIPNPVIPNPVISSPAMSTENSEESKLEEEETQENSSTEQEPVNEEENTNQESVEEEVEENQEENTIPENGASQEPENQEEEPVQENREEPTLLNSPQQKIFVSQIHRTIAKTLDRDLSSRPRLEDYVNSGISIDNIRDYVHQNLESFRRRALKEITTDESLLSNFETDFEIETALGKTNNMLDSMLPLPVYSSIALRKGGNNHFSSIENQIASSSYISISPVAKDKDHFYGDICEVPIHIEDVQDAKSWLAKQGYRIRDYKNDSEKLYLYTFALANVLGERFFSHPKTGDLTRMVEDLTEDYVLPAGQEVGTHVVDARTTSLTEQLNEIEEKGVKMATPERTPLTHPEVVSPLIRHNENTITPPSPVAHNLEQEEADRKVIAASSRALGEQGISLTPSKNSNTTSNVATATSNTNHVGTWQESDNMNMYELFKLGKDAAEQEAKKHR